MGPRAATRLGATPIAALVLMVGCGDERPSEDHDAGSESTAPLLVRATGIPQDGEPVGEGLLTVDPSTGQSDPLSAPGFSGGDAQFAFVPSRDGVAYRCSEGACVRGLDPEATQATLGEAWCIAPSTSAGHVWLAELDPESPATERAITSVTEVRFDGQVTIGPSTLPSRRWHCPVGFFDGGVLFQDDAGIVAWDAETSSVRMTIPDVFPAASGGTSVVTYPDEGEGGLRLTDVETGTDRLIDPPSGWRFEPSYEGAFSPDGSRVAVTVRPADTERVKESGIAVVALADDRAVVVPSDPLMELAWAPDGEELYAATYGENGIGEAISVYDEDLRPMRVLRIGARVLAVEVLPE